MRYVEWGDPGNPRVLLCVHGLTRTGRDFDHLARALAGGLRVVCPDVAGRGRSDWLRNPLHYQISQYAADMVTLIARLNAKELYWLGTSMGGLIGIGLAGLPDAPIAKLILNDVGPHLEIDGLMRIGAYVGTDMHFDSIAAAEQHLRTICAGFGMRSDDDWREFTASVLRPDGAGFVLHYDPAIGTALRALTPELALAGEQMLWQLYDAIACPTLLLRGENSDLLSRETAVQMRERGPRPRTVTVAGVGHAPMFFDPGQIALVRDFLG
jgi:pimeloyl-ACP methyl ester carboxylesterase